MRLWSLHPKYLDAKGLVALWRETLLAKNVLEGKTKGYKNHPQLNRFISSRDAVKAINFYLKFVWLESYERNYNFKKNKFVDINDIEQISVTHGQLDFEKEHLISKLRLRDLKIYNEIMDVKAFDCHPIFHIVNGEIESWEKI